MRRLSGIWSGIKEAVAELTEDSSKNQAISTNYNQSSTGNEGYITQLDRDSRGKSYDDQHKREGRERRENMKVSKSVVAVRKAFNLLVDFHFGEEN